MFRAGLSTKDEVTNISGRGVGMDVVRTALRTGRWQHRRLVRGRARLGVPAQRPADAGDHAGAHRVGRRRSATPSPRSTSKRSSYIAAEDMATHRARRGRRPHPPPSRPTAAPRRPRRRVRPAPSRRATAPASSSSWSRRPVAASASWSTASATPPRWSSSRSRRRSERSAVRRRHHPERRRAGADPRCRRSGDARRHHRRNVRDDRRRLDTLTGGDARAALLLASDADGSRLAVDMAARAPPRADRQRFGRALGTVRSRPVSGRHPSAHPRGRPCCSAATGSRPRAPTCSTPSCASRRSAWSVSSSTASTTSSPGRRRGRRRSRRAGAESSPASSSTTASRNSSTSSRSSPTPASGADRMNERQLSARSTWTAAARHRHRARRRGPASTRRSRRCRWPTRTSPVCSISAARSSPPSTPAGGSGWREHDLRRPARIVVIRSGGESVSLLVDRVDDVSKSMQSFRGRARDNSGPPSMP